MLFACFCWWLKEWEVAAGCHMRLLTGETCLLNASVIVKFSFEFVWHVLSAFCTSEKMTSVGLQGHVVILKVVPKGILNLQECSHLRPLSVIVTKWSVSIYIYIYINPFHALVFCRMYKKEISTDVRSLYFRNLTLTWQLEKKLSPLQDYVKPSFICLHWYFCNVLAVKSSVYNVGTFFYVYILVILYKFWQWRSAVGSVCRNTLC